MVGFHFVLLCCFFITCFSFCSSYIIWCVVYFMTGLSFCLSTSMHFVVYFMTVCHLVRQTLYDTLFILWYSSTRAHIWSKYSLSFESEKYTRGHTILLSPLSLKFVPPCLAGKVLFLPGFDGVLKTYTKGGLWFYWL